MMAVRLTREGRRFIVLLAIIAFAAYNTRNNLLYLMLSVGLGVLVLSLVMGYLAMARLAVAGSETPEAYAGEPFGETLSLGNTSRWLDVFGIEITDGTAPVPLVPRRGKTLCKRTRLYRRRGVYEGEPVETASHFPYGLFRFRRTIDPKRSLVVFPKVRPVEASWLARDRLAGGSQVLRRGIGEEFYRLRSYVPGDHVHLVHWKTSAKQGEIMVRECGGVSRGPLHAPRSELPLPVGHARTASRVLGRSFAERAHAPRDSRADSRASRVGDRPKSRAGAG